MRTVFYFLAIVTALFITLYMLLFSAIGNFIVKPFVQNKAAQILQTELNITEFTLRINKISLKLQTQNGSFLDFDANYNIFNQSLRGEYSAVISEQLPQIKDLPHFKQRVFIDGTIKGDYRYLQLSGVSKVGGIDGSKGSYAINLSKMGLKNATVEFTEFNPLVLLGSDHPLAALSSSLDLLAKFDKTTDKGFIKAFIGAQNGQNRLEFDLQLDITEGKKLDGVYELLLHSQNTTDSIDFRGDIEGEIDSFTISGISDHNALQANLATSFIDKQLEKIDLFIDYADIGMLTQLFTKSPPTYGSASFNLSLKDLIQGGYGHAKLRVRDAQIDNSTLLHHFDKTLGTNSGYELLINSKIDKDTISSIAIIEADIGSTTIENILYDRHNRSLYAEFTVNVLLQKLQPFFKKEFTGGITTLGELSYEVGEKKRFDLQATSDSFGGVSELQFDSNTIKGVMQRANTQKFQQMFHLQELLVGEYDAIGVYNLGLKSGWLELDLTRSFFQPSNLTFTLQEHTGVDLTIQEFSKASVKADIDYNIVTVLLKIRSKDVKIDSKNITINTDTQRLRGNISLLLKDQRYNIKVDGYVDDIQGALDYEDLLRQEVQRQIEIKAREFIEKELGEDILHRFRQYF